MEAGSPGGARNHHFVPQYYLKGFATPRSKDGKLCVFDLLPLLEQRQWTLMIAPHGSRGFVTSDRPYALRWSDPALREGFYPPGLGCDDTNLTFPLSRDLALVGRFDAARETVEIDERMVASINLMTFSSAMTQLYADGDFSILEPGETVGAFSQSELWRRVREAPRGTSVHAD